VTDLVAFAAAAMVANAVLVAAMLWFHVRLMGERKTLLNAALARTPNEFRNMEREPQPLPRRVRPPEDPRELAAKVSAGMGDEPYRMPEGLNGG